MLGLVVQYDLELEQMDVKTIFPHGDLDGTIYMVRPHDSLILKDLIVFFF